MKQYLIDLKSFRVEAPTEIAAMLRAEEMLKSKQFVPEVEYVEETD